MSVQSYGSLNFLCHWPSLRWEWKLTFSSHVTTCWLFQICWHIECSTLTASSFKIWNSSTGIPWPPLALFVVMLPNCFWEGVRISRIWATTHFLVFWQCLGTVIASLGMSFHLSTEDQVLVLSAILVPFDSNLFSLYPWATSFFQSCALPLSLLLHNDYRKFLK